MDITILPPQTDQVAALTVFARQIFFSTFEHTVDAENMRHYLDSEMNENVFAAQLTDPLYKTFLVWKSGEICGYIQFYYNPNESYQDIKLELKRFYVDSRFHGQGIAGPMMEFCFQEIERMGEKRVWLGVWENNFKALKFYKKWGFNEIDEHLFVTGTESQRDLILARSF
jgi:ribosomal protein S18 acetylase RimI-like enzyme